MKKAMRIILPILLTLVIIGCMIWYLFVYDRVFARDMLLSGARFSEEQGYFSLSTWFYERAYDLASQDGASKDQVAIELAEQYQKNKNFTKAEFTLTNAIADGAGIDVYIALCKTYIAQDKLYDAVKMLDTVSNPEIKAQLDQMRPETPKLSHESGLYNQYLTITITAKGGKLYTAAGGKYPSTKTAPSTKPINLAEGENSIYALVLADNGLVSGLATGSYTIGGIIKEIDFADPAIEAEVRRLLNVSDERILYTNDLWKLTEFTVPEDAQCYDDLQHMKNLTALTIEDGVQGNLTYIGQMLNLTDLTIKNTIVDKDAVDAIGKLSIIKNLTLQGCNLTNISVFANLTAVENLDLSHNVISDISALSAMKKLKTVNLEHNVIAAVSALTGLTAIETLDLSNNNISSLAPITDIATLTWLDAETNIISDLGELSGLTSLTYLNLKSNKLSNVGKITNCSNLVELNIASNSLYDISKLSGLLKLERLDFSYNQVSVIPTFISNCALVTIDGSYNSITDVSPLSGLENLNNVYMDYNSELSSIQSLTACYNLIEVHVYGTKVTDIIDLVNMSVVVIK